MKITRKNLVQTIIVLADALRAYSGGQSSDLKSADEMVNAFIHENRSPRGMKPFLLTAEVRDGEHEYTRHCIVRARTFEAANRKAEKLFPKESRNEYALDHPKAYFGFGDRLTLSRFEGLQEITEEEAFILKKVISEA